MYWKRAIEEQNALINVNVTESIKFTDGFTFPTATSFWETITYFEVSSSTILEKAMKIPLPFLHVSIGIRFLHIPQ